MSSIKPLAQTKDTVTLRRADFLALLETAGERKDLAAVAAHRAYESRVGWELARRNYLTRSQAERLLDGESPVRIWRQKRGFSQRALAAAAGIAASYLAEIETLKKPGSNAALVKIAAALEVPLEIVAHLPGMAPEAGLRPVTRSEEAAKRLSELAERGADRTRIEEEVRTILSEWRDIAERAGARHQLKAAISALRAILTERSGGSTRRAEDKKCATLQVAIEVLQNERRSSQGQFRTRDAAHSVRGSSR